MILDVSVVIPTYNEAESIPVIIPSICEVLRIARINGEIVVVDDNSPDGTGKIAEELSKTYPVRTIIRTKERGLATAVIAGFSLSDAVACIVMDADGSHPVDKLPDMVRPILEDKADITVASRHVKGGGIGEWPLHRQLVSKVASLMAKGVTSMKDPTSGFMAVRRELLNGLQLNPVGWKIVLEVVVKAHNKRLIEIPIAFNDRVLGKSKMSLKEQWSYITHLYRLYEFRMSGFVEFIKFCLVGFSGVFVDTGVVIAAKTFFGLDTRLCAVLGFAFAVTTNYILNRMWTFEGKRSTSMRKSYITFVAVCCTGLLARLAAMHLLIVFADLDKGYRYVVNNFIGIAIGTAVNFSGSKYFAFTGKRLALNKQR